MALCGYRILLMANCAILAAAAGAGRRAPAPLLFLGTIGQGRRPFRFMARAPGLTAYFSPGEVLFRVAGNTLRMQFEGAAHASRPEAMSRLTGVANFLTGPKDRWPLAQPLYLKTAVETPPSEPSSSAISIWSNGICHPFGELRSTWKPRQVSDLRTVLGVNRRF